jgi:type I restriction enzyme S subunit
MKLTWPTKKLSKCVEEGLIELKRGIVISEKDMKECPGSYPVYSSSSQNNGLFGTYGKYMFDEELITWSVDGGGYFFYRPKHKFSVTNVVGILRLLTNDLIYKFVYYHLVWQRSRLEFDYVKKAHPSVIKDLYDIAFLPLPIQQKIVKILDTIQEAIDIQEKIIEKTKELKKSLMAELFKYGGPSFRKGRKLKKTEVGEIPEDWEVVKIKNIVLDTEQNDPSKIPLQEIKYIDVSSISNEFLKIMEYKTYLGKDAPSRARKILKVNDVIFATVRPYLKRIALITEEYNGFYGSTAFCVLRPNIKKISPYFLFYYVSTDKFVYKVSGYQTGSGYPAITDDHIKNEKIPLPPLPEQQEIAEILQTIDQKIEIEKRKKELHEELFKTMLNKIMSQEIDINLLDY